MSLKLALLFVSMVTVSCRTVTLEEVSLSLTEKSEGLDSPTRNILRSFLNLVDVTSGQKLRQSLQGCGKGICKYCRHRLGHDECFVATLDDSSIKIQLTVDGRTVLETSIDASVPHPQKICKEHIAGVNTLTDVCVQVKKINFKNASGCVDVSFKVSGKPYFKEMCFKIPKTDDENDESDSVEVIQVGYFLEFEPLTSMPKMGERK